MPTKYNIVNTQPGYTYSRGLTSTMRDLLIKHSLCSYAKAEEVAREFDALMVAEDSIFTYNGTTYNVSFRPSFYK